jgi:twinkle protein
MPFINNHFKFLQQDDGKKATFESIIERIKTAVFRWGINGIVIDPFNYIARPKGMDKETEWIDDMLTQLRLTAVIYDLHIWMVAHPTKMQMDHEGNYPPPRGFSISGSAAWYSKADFGLTVHKVGNGGLVRVINWKTRYSWLGKEGEAQLTYDSTQNVYLDDIIADARAYYHPHPDDEVPF